MMLTTFSICVLLPQRMASCLHVRKDGEAAIRSAFRAAEGELCKLLVKGSATSDNSSDHDILSGTVVCVALLIHEHHLHHRARHCS